MKIPTGDIEEYTTNIDCNFVVEISIKSKTDAHIANNTVDDIDISFGCTILINTVTVTLLYIQVGWKDYNIVKITR